jgi:ATP-binding cassette subfamily C (CFTR/MRP) protein 1
LVSRSPYVYYPLSLLFFHTRLFTSPVTNTLFPSQVLPVVFSSLVEAYVSLDRLTDFLVAKEIQGDSAVTFSIPSRELKAGDELVSVVKGDFTWNPLPAEEAEVQTVPNVSLPLAFFETLILLRTILLLGLHSHSPSLSQTLEDITLSVKKGELIAVVGQVGAGKSSLLSAILGELHKVEGQVTVRGTVAYTAQSPWIMGGTVRVRPLFSSCFFPSSPFPLSARRATSPSASVTNPSSTRWCSRHAL